MNRGRHKKTIKSNFEKAIKILLYSKDSEVGYFIITVFNNDRNYPLVQNWNTFNNEDFAREWLKSISRKWDYVDINTVVVLDSLTNSQREKLKRYKQSVDIL